MDQIKIPIAKTDLKKNEIESLLEPLRSGWLVQGPKVREFEDSWNSFTGAENSIAVTSCTSAMHLSLAALGFSSKDEAIVPAFTWISTANVVEHLGGKVIFCDIDLSSFNIDTSKIEPLVNKKTKAILPVHLFGLAANMPEINSLAKDYKLWVIEDAACGFGSKIDNRHVGNFGDVGCFSFHPRKAITTGEGGMITTNNSNLAEKIRCLRDHGAITNDLQRHLGPKPYILADHSEAGFNQRMTDIQGALGSAQMKRAKLISEERKRLAERYNDAFDNIKWIRTPTLDNGNHGFQSYACLFEPESIQRALITKNYDAIKTINKKRNSWMDFLFKKGISTRPSTHAVHMLSYYKRKYNLKPTDFPNAFAANDCSISLPLFHGMTKKEQNHVIEIVKESFN